MDRVGSWLETYGAPITGGGVPLAQALSEVERETGVSFARARARVGFARGHLLDVSLQLPGGSGSDREHAAADLLLRRMLGELTCERWIGSLAVVPAPRGGALVVVTEGSSERASIALAELSATLQAAQRGLYQGLPELPHARTPESADWLMFELSPEPAHDYAAQDDLVLSTTLLPEQKKSFLRGEPFFSGRFSKHAELYVYLKYQGVKAAPEQRLSERARLEAALLSLRPELAALVGAGFGLRYGYLDLALCDASRALALLPALLQKAGAPKRSWLLFCDSALEREFLPIWPGAPAPYFG